MDAMVAHVEPLNQAPFEHFAPWRCHEALDRDDGASITPPVLLPAAISTLQERLSQRISRTGAAQGLPTYAQEIPASSVAGTSTASMTSTASTPCPSAASVSRPSSLPATSGQSKASAFLAEQSTTLSFTRELPAMQLAIRSAPTHPHAGSSTKRRRPDSDVDGPHTAALGIKKRRLLRQRVTSRLGQPSTHPVPQLISRETTAGAAGGRVLRMAAVVSARRLLPSSTHQHPPPPASPQDYVHQPSPSSVLRRAAILNRFRLRVFREAADRGDAVVAGVAANAGLLRQTSRPLGFELGLAVGAQNPPAALPPSHHHRLAAAAAPASPSFQSAHPPVPPPDVAPRPILRSPSASPLLLAGRLPPPVLAPPPPRRPAPIPLPAQLQPDPTHPHPLSRAAAEARSSPPASPRALRPVTEDTPAGLLLPPLRSRGLGLLARRDGGQEEDSDEGESFFFGRERGDADKEEDEDDEEEVAFPTSEHESRYMYDDGDDDGVYADFSVIFGGTGGGSRVEEADDGQDGASVSTSGSASAPGPGPDGGVAELAAAGAGAVGELYEGYLDDVDGIPWMAR